MKTQVWLLVFIGLELALSPVLYALPMDTAYTRDPVAETPIAEDTDGDAGDVAADPNNKSWLEDLMDGDGKVDAQSSEYEDGVVVIRQDDGTVIIIVKDKDGKVTKKTVYTPPAPAPEPGGPLA